MEAEQTGLEQPFLGDLRLSRRLISLRQVTAAGLVIILGLAFMLPGYFQRELGITSSAAIILAAVILGLTLLNIIELLAGSSERGGSYVLVHESWGGTAGFATGWALLALGITLAATFFQALGASLLFAFPALSPYSMVIPVAAFVLMVMIQLFGFIPFRNRTWLLVLMIIVGVAILSFISITRPENKDLVSTLPGGEFSRAAAWGLLIFASLEVLLSGRRQIQDPKRHLPQGLMVSLFLSSILISAMLGLATSTNDHPASLALIARLGGADFIRQSFAVGIGSIAFFIAANNALMVAARQVYALSRFGALPRGFTTVRKPFRLPPLIFVLLIALTTPILWLPTELLLDVGAAAALIVCSVLNLAAIASGNRFGTIRQGGKIGSHSPVKRPKRYSRT